jgi:hypothetical protein
MNFVGRALALTAMVLLGANSSMAQMHAGGPDDLSESPAIYSPYVERTAVDASRQPSIHPMSSGPLSIPIWRKAFTGATPIYTPAIPPMPA